MINASRTGAYISALRKAKDWTQLDLAQRLQVTHQAVSQWEQGASFPDVALLPSLARTLGVSVDDLLNGAPAPAQPTGRLTTGGMVQELARATPRHIADLVRQDPAGVDRMLEAAPLAKPSQMNEVVANLAGFQFSLAQVADLAPFVSREVLNDIIDSAQLEQVEGELLIELAPFVGQDTLGRWLSRLTPGSLTIETVEHLAPFIKRETLSAMVFQWLGDEQPLTSEQLVHLAPFVGRESLTELIRRQPRGTLTLAHLLHLAPFIGAEGLDQLLAELPEPAALSDYLKELAPFLSKPTLRRALSDLHGHLSAQQLVELAPFLDRETLEAIFRQGMQQPHQRRPGQ